MLTAEPSFKVDVVPTLLPAELMERIGEYDAFVGRSATRVTDELQQPQGLGPGLDPVGVEAWTQRAQQGVGAGGV